MPRFASKTLLLTSLLFLVCFVARPQTLTNTTVYLYDELGRLKAVVTPSGDAAIYNYDAAGNIVSITRQLSTTVSVIAFTPDEGASGTSVTIYGTGFSLTPSQNSVSFNGVPATVSAASGTQLIVVVPAGAATGPITVTTPAGSATSTDNFAVLDSLSITGFTPTIGTPGTAVQVTGTDFDPVAANNQVKFNITSAVTTSSTATTISTTVPTGATSGHITLTTPAGTAISSGDFFVPPSPFTAASVDHASRIAIGETKQLSVTTANRIAMLVFDGTVGQRISLQATSSTISSSTVRVIRPDGTNLFNPTSLSGNWFIDTLTLPVTGTYTIVIDPNSTFTGSMNLTLHNVPADVSPTITAGGPPVTVTTTTPGQNANLTFEGTTGQRVSLLINNVTITSSSVTIRRPDGTTLATQTSVGTAGAFFDTMTLPATGTYSIFINPQGAATGAMTLSLHVVPADVTGTIVIGGPHVPVTIGTPGQNAQITFTGTAGQIVELDWMGQLVINRPVFLKPDGTTLIDDFGFWDDDDIYRLPATGTYTIVLDGFAGSTGTTTLALYEIPEPPTYSIVADGPPVVVTVPTGGQHASVTFNGTAGQRVSIRISEVHFTWAYVEVRNPNGSWIGDSDILPEWEFDGSRSDPLLLIDTMTLNATGTYTINVFPDFISSGSVKLELFTVPPDVTGTIVPGGPPVTVTTTVPGQNARLTFNGTSGQRLSLKITESILPFSLVDVFRPDGTRQVIQEQTTPDGGGFRDIFTLTTTGTYTIEVDAYLYLPGTTTMQLHVVPPVSTGTLTINGPPVTITSTAPGEDKEMTFNGTAGQRISLKVTAPVDSDLFLIRPNNQNLLSSRLTRQIGPVSAELFEAVVLPTTGTYKIRVDTWKTTGDITFDLYEVPPDVQAGTITIGGPPVTVTSTAPRQNRILTFNGTAGQTVYLKIDNNNSWLNLVTILKPDGFVQHRRLADDAASKLIEGTTLTQTGTYTILTELFGDGDSVTLTLGEGSGDISGTLEMDGQPVTINVPTSRQLARYFFNGTPGQRVGLRRTDITMQSGGVGLIGNDTECCFQASVSSTGKGSDRFSVVILPPTGPYLVSVDPAFDFTGGATVRLFPVPADLTGTLTINGPPVTLTTTTPGQNATLTMEGTTGQQVTLRVTNNSIGKIVFEITRPTGWQQTYWIDSGATFDLPVQILPTPGTYTISINPMRANTGTVTITATSQ